jgi:putative Mg2+ transporter-C (MgtC) family protein
MIYEVRGTDETTMFEEIFSVLDREHLRLVILDRDKLGAVERVTFTISASSDRHKHLLAELIESDATDKVVAYRDEEED